MSKRNLLLFGSLFFVLAINAGVVYHAESAMLSKAVTETKNSGFLGSSYINFDNEPGSYLELIIGMAESGVQTVTVRFANGGTVSRPMDITLNGELIFGSFSFEPGGSWTDWDTVSFKADFEKGPNTLRLTSVGSEGGPNIDQFEVTGTQSRVYELLVSATGEGHVVTVPSAGPFYEGQTVILIAKPAFNAVFKAWSGDASGNEDTINVIMDGDKALVALFEEIELIMPDPDFSMKGYASVSRDGIETTTGGAGGKVIVIETLEKLIEWGASRENNNTPETVILKGKIEATNTVTITIKRGSNISILGDSESNGAYAELKNVSLNIRDYSNVIVRNLKMHEVFYPNDDLTIDACSHVWIDHCEFHSKIGPGIGVDTYDGLLDIKKGSHNVTVSWCWFHDHMKTVLIGHSDNNGSQDVNLQVTFHHNWFSNTDGRNPSLRFGQVHYFNNYLENISDYGLAIRNGAHALIENCHFENVKLPIATDKFQGHGFACVSGCIYTGTTTEADNEITPPYDCAFWASEVPYDYTLENVSTVSLSVRAYAGVGKISIATSTTLVQNQNNLMVSGLFFNKTTRKIHFTASLEKHDELIVSVYTIHGMAVATKTLQLNQGSHPVELDMPITIKIIPGLYIVKVATSRQIIGNSVFVY